MAEHLKHVWGRHLAAERLLPMGAALSEDGHRRRHLWRCWDAKLPRLGWLCLNPSTADATRNDASARKMVGFAERLGYGAIDVVNLFDWRTAYPEELYRAGVSYELSTKQNDGAILLVARATNMLICAWGRHGMYQRRAAIVLGMLKQRRHADKLCVLKINADGSPAHPLMLPFKLRPVIYKEALWPR